MAEMEIGLLVTLALVLAAEFVNGWTDAPNAITTVVSTKALTMQKAVALASVLNVLGAMSGTAVAATIGKGIIESSVIDLTTVAAAMSAIVIWSVAAWRFGLPTSESHALVAALAGAGLATAGPDVMLWAGWKKVLIGLSLSTCLGLLGAYIFTKIVRAGVAPFPSYKTKPALRRLQILSSAFMAFSHGSNDGQKFIGVFALALLISGVGGVEVIGNKLSIPLWVILLCASVMGCGTLLGGLRIIRTMGVKMARIEAYQGFSAETAAASTIIIASHFGIPLSTTHTIGTSLMGTTLARRRSALRIGIVKNIVLAWLLTFPVCGALAFLITFVLRFVFN